MAVRQTTIPDVDENDSVFLGDVIDLHDDTEEDLAGSDLHQTAIRVLNEGLLLAGPERGLPWHVSNQLTVLMGYLGGKEWHPSPDILVHPTAGPEPRSSFDTSVEGVPPFIIEVASPSTWVYDVGTKRRSYGRKGVQEYIVFDPTTELLHRPVRAWHRTPRGFVPWKAGPDGRWHSEILGLSFEPVGMLLRIYDENGELIPTISEQSRQIAAERRRADEERRQQERRIAELEAELRRLRGSSGDTT